MFMFPAHIDNHATSPLAPTLAYRNDHAHGKHSKSTTTKQRKRSPDKYVHIIKY